MDIIIDIGIDRHTTAGDRHARRAVYLRGTDKNACEPARSARTGAPASNGILQVMPAASPP